MAAQLRTLVWLALGIAGGFVGVDLAARQISPLPPRIMEVDDGVDALAAARPDILVLGSSHARSFVPMIDALAEPANGGQRMVVVPAEWGTFTGYHWILKNRLAPLIDERDGTGALLRRDLRRVLLITTFYDMCELSNLNVSNIPARAWGPRHFWRDLLASGVTDYNRNYLQTRWRELFRWSVLAQNRGYNRIEAALVERLRGRSHADMRAERVAGARALMEAQYPTCDDALQKAELDGILRFFAERGIETTIVVFPLMPSIVSERSRQTTVKRYADYLAQLRGRHAFRVVDLTYGSPMGDDDFEDDTDHLTRDANRRFSAWALAGDLAFLKAAAEPAR